AGFCSSTAVASFSCPTSTRSFGWSGSGARRSHRTWLKSAGGKRGIAMAWSTRELAELAQTTVNTIRHYHHLGLLAEPARKDNGYKQYGVKHLARLLRIRRLV